MGAKKWRWPSRLNPCALDIIAKHKTGGATLSVLANAYRVKEQEMRELLKHYGVYVYKRPDAVRNLRRHYEERKQALVERACLCCRKMFGSTGAGNRICSRCKALDIFESGGCAEDFPGGRI